MTSQLLSWICVRRFPSFVFSTLHTLLFSSDYPVSSTSGPFFVAIYVGRNFLIISTLYNGLYSLLFFFEHVSVTSHITDWPDSSNFFLSSRAIIILSRVSKTGWLIICGLSLKLTDLDYICGCFVVFLMGQKMKIINNWIGAACWNKKVSLKIIVEE